MKKFVLFALLLIAVLVVACAPAPTATPVPPTQAPAPTAVPPTAVPATKAPEPTKAPAATAAPTVAPTKAAEPTKAPVAAAASPTAAPKPTTPAPKCEPVGAPITVKAGDLGSTDKPIVLSFVPSGDVARITKGGQDIGDCLKKMYGLNFRIEVGTTFAASIEAMGANKAQVGFLNTFSVLLAREKYQIEPALAVMRKYNTNAIDPDKADAGKLTAYYKGQFIAKKDSGIKTYADLKGKTFCFVDPNSTSGYIIPNIILKANGINSEKDLKAVQNAGSHNNVGIAVYKGDCDAGVTFIDVLTDAAANLKATYPDIADKVVAFAVTDKIPNDGVQFVKGFDPAMKKAITDGLVAMAKDPGGNAVLRSIYSIDDFQVIDAKFYDEFAGVLKKAGVDPASLVK